MDVGVGVGQAGVRRPRGLLGTGQRVDLGNAPRMSTALEGRLQPRFYDGSDNNSAMVTSLAFMPTPSGGVTLVSSMPVRTA